MCTGSSSGGGGKSAWRCDVCGYSTSVARNLRIHMTSEKHAHNLQMLLHQQQQQQQSIPKNLAFSWRDGSYKEVLTTTTTCHDPLDRSTGLASSSERLPSRDAMLHRTQLQQQQQQLRLQQQQQQLRLQQQQQQLRLQHQQGQLTPSPSNYHSSSLHAWSAGPSAAGFLPLQTPVDLTRPCSVRSMPSAPQPHNGNAVKRYTSYIYRTSIKHL